MYYGRKMLKIILLLLPVLTLVIAGEGSDLPEDQVEEVLALYHKHCKPSGYGQSTSSLGANVNIVCKEGREDYEAPRKQIIKIPPVPVKKSVLFVEAPTYRVNHQINLVRDSEEGAKSVIYVLSPKKILHTYNVVSGSQNSPSKPQVFFLKGNSNTGASQYPQPSQPIYGPPPPSQPQQEYGPPPPSQPQPGPPASQPQQSYGQPEAPVPSPTKVTYSQPIYNPPQNAQGPQYEIVQNAPVQNAYQSFFSQLQQQQPQQQIVFQQEQLGQNQLYATEQDGRVIFPSESIQHQQYHFSPLEYRGQQNQNEQYVQEEPEEQPNNYDTESSEDPESQEGESVIRPSDFPRQLTKRRLPSSSSVEAKYSGEDSEEQESQNKEEFEIGKDYIPNYNDYYNYMGFRKEYGLKSEAEQDAPEKARKTAKTNNKNSPESHTENTKNNALKSSLSKFLQINQTQSTTPSQYEEGVLSTTTSNPSRVLTSYTIAEDTNRRPVIAKSGFEIIPAALVSYSYSKTNNPSNDAYGKAT